MREIVRTNDAVLVSAIGALLDGANIQHLVFDQNMSVLEGSLGVLPRRVLVADEEVAAARQLLKTPGSAMSCVPMSAERDAVQTSDDAVLGGRLRLRQPRRGHRVGHDAILLAAATGGRAGEQAVDLGAGVGGAGLALAARVAGLEVTLVEIDEACAALARENARLNGLDERVRALAGRRGGYATRSPPRGCRRQHRPRADEPALQRSAPAERLARSAPASGACGGARPVAALGRDRGLAAQAGRRADADLARRWRWTTCWRRWRPSFGDVAVLPVLPRPERCGHSRAGAGGERRRGAAARSSRPWCSTTTTESRRRPRKPCCAAARR